MPPAPDSTTPRPLAIGERIGSYTVVSRLGGGAASAVYHARHSETGDEVAIKQFLVDGADDEDSAFRRRLREEGPRLMQLSRAHPRMVKLHDFLLSPRGTFAVMELVRSTPLDEVLAQSGRPVPRRSLIKTVHAVAGALAALHDRGAIHGNLKPGNLLISSMGGLKLADAGMASLISEQEALPLDSVRYMAPEVFEAAQMQGDEGEAARARVGPAADLYSLGMIAYEMAAGPEGFAEAFRPVLRDQRNTAMRWMKWHTNPRATPPPVGEINPDVKGPLADLIGRLIEKDRSRRLSVATELQKAILHNFGDTDADADPAQSSANQFARNTASRHPNAPGDTADIPRPRRWPRLLAACLAVLVLLGGVAAGGLYLRQNMQASAARDAYLAEAEAALAAADTSYQSHDYAAAVEQYQRFIEDYPDIAQSRPTAAAGLALAGARQALSTGSDAEAQAWIADFTSPSGPQREDLRLIQDEIADRQGFATSTAAIAESIAAGRLTQAEEALNDFTGRTLTDPEGERIQELRSTLADQRTQTQLEGELAEATALREAGDLDAAITRLDQIHTRFGGERVRSLLIEATRERDLAAVMQAIADAEAEDDYDAAIRGLARAQAMGVAGLEERTGRIKSEQAFAQGRRLHDAGREDEALSAFVRATGYADHPEARGYIQMISQDLATQEAERAGDAAFASREFAAAAKHYEAALVGEDNEGLRQKIRTSKAQMHLARAESLVNAARYDDARVAYADARAADPGVDIQPELALLDARNEYDRLKALGDEARQASHFGDADRYYRQARQVIRDTSRDVPGEPTPEITALLQDVEYAKWLALARAQIEARQFTEAAATIRTASQIRHTEQLETLRKLLEVRAALH